MSGYLPHEDEVSPTFLGALHAHLVITIRAALTLCIVLAAAGLMWVAFASNYRAGETRKNLAQAIETSYGLRVRPSELLLLGGIPSTSRPFPVARPCVFLAASTGGKDVYYAWARVSSRGVPLSVSTPVNLSATPGLDERILVAAGVKVAFFVPGQAIHVVRFPPAGAADIRSIGALERTLRTGSPRPPRHWSVSVPYPKVALKWTGNTLLAAPPRGKGTPLSLDTDTGHLIGRPGSALREHAAAPMPAERLLRRLGDTLKSRFSL